PGRAERRLHDGVAAVGALPDGEGVAGRVERHLRRVRVLAGGGEVDGGGEAPAGRAEGGLHDGVAAVGALPDGEGVAGRVERHLRRVRVLAGGGEVDGGREAPPGRAERGLHDGVAAVGALPDGEGVAGRVERHLRQERVLAGGGEVDGGGEAPPGR